MDELDKVILSLEKQTNSPFSYLERDVPFILTKCYEAKSRLLLIERKNIIRPQPFGILVSGPPGTGKSFGTLTLCKQLYNLNHADLLPEQIVVLNEGDEFQSEFRTQHKVVIFDDLGATKVNVVSHDPFRKLIDFINNIPKTALNPHLELKGNVWIEPDIVAVTTNLPIPFTGDTQQNTGAVYCPEALNRRFPLMIYQLGYNEFKVIQDRYKPAHGWKYHNNFAHIPTWNRDEVLSYAREQYLDHCRSQDSFVDMVNRELITTHPSVSDYSLEPNSSLFTVLSDSWKALKPTMSLSLPQSNKNKDTFSVAHKPLKAESAFQPFPTLIAAQQGMRVTTGRITFSYPKIGLFFLLCKRALSKFLSNLKNSYRNVYISQLYTSGISNIEIGPYIEMTESNNRILPNIISLLSFRNEADLISILLSICLYSKLKGIASTYIYDFLYFAIPSSLGIVYRSMFGGAENDWPLFKLINGYFAIVIATIADFISNITSYFYPSSRLKAEGKMEYVRSVIDIPFIEACLEDQEIRPTDEFWLVIFTDGIIIYHKNAQYTYSKSLCESLVVPCQGLRLSKEEFLYERYRYYESHKIVPEGKFSKKHMGSGTVEAINDEVISNPDILANTEQDLQNDDNTVFEVRYKRSKKNLNFYPRQFRTENSPAVVSDFIAGKCSIVKCLNAMGALENAQLCFVPNFHLTEDNEFVRGRISLIYFKHRKRMYIIVREKNNLLNFDFENVIKLFGKSCPIHAIACPTKGTNRYVLPLVEEDPYPLRDDLAVMHLHFEVQHVMYGCAFAIGSLFRYKSIQENVLYKSICVKYLELLSSKVKESSGSLRDGESYEIATPKNLDNIAESQETQEN